MNNTRISITVIVLQLSALIILLSVITGCTVISEADCRYADFSTIGYDDANKGRPRTRFNAYQEKCLSYDVDVANEIVMYDYGRERGLIGYCTRVRESRQCGINRGADTDGIKSYIQIRGEMLLLRSITPPAVIR